MLEASPARIVLDSKGDILLAGVSAAIGMVHGPIVNVCPHKSTGKPFASCAQDAPEPTTKGTVALHKMCIYRIACQSKPVEPLKTIFIRHGAVLLDPGHLVSSSRWHTRRYTIPNCSRFSMPIRLILALQLTLSQHSNSCVRQAKLTTLDPRSIVQQEFGPLLRLAR